MLVICSRPTIFIRYFSLPFLVTCRLRITMTSSGLFSRRFRLSGPIFSDIAAMERQQKYMWVAHFLSSLISSFDGVQPQILGAKELPSLSEVFSHLHHATLPSVTPSPTNRFTLVASIGPLAPLDLISPWFWPWLAQSP